MKTLILTLLLISLGIDMPFVKNFSVIETVSTESHVLSNGDTPEVINLAKKILEKISENKAKNEKVSDMLSEIDNILDANPDNVCVRKKGKGMRELQKEMKSYIALEKVYAESIEEQLDGIKHAIKNNESKSAEILAQALLEYIKGARENFDEVGELFSSAIAVYGESC